MVDRAYNSGRTPLAQLRVEHRRQGVDAGTFGKKGDGKIVERHGNRHQESGKYTGFDLRPGHLVERVHRSGTEHDAAVLSFHGTDADRGKRSDDGRDKPPHTTRDFELLKESTMSTRIGRYKNKKMAAR